MDGQILGTPRFMAPEQAAGRIDELDERTDIYALGAILYTLLVLQPPVTGASTGDVLRNVARGAIKPPGQVAPPPRAWLPGRGMSRS